MTSPLQILNSIVTLQLLILRIAISDGELTFIEVDIIPMLQVLHYHIAILASN